MRALWAPQEVVFEPDAAGAPGPHVCQSRCANFIGFEVEIALLLRVLRSAAAHEAQLLEMRLTVRAVPGVAADAASQRPMLLFSWHGDSVALGQEMPIGKPYVEVVLKQVRALCEAPTLCPFYLDILPDVAQLMVCATALLRPPILASCRRTRLLRVLDPLRALFAWR